jgi:hypothetical protein
VKGFLLFFACAHFSLPTLAKRFDGDHISLFWRWFSALILTILPSAKRFATGAEEKNEKGHRT